MRSSPSFTKTKSGRISRHIVPMEKARTPRKASGFRIGFTTADIAIVLDDSSARESSPVRRLIDDVRERKGILTPSKTKKIDENTVETITPGRRKFSLICNTGTEKQGPRGQKRIRIGLFQDKEQTVKEMAERRAKSGKENKGYKEDKKNKAPHTPIARPASSHLTVKAEISPETIKAQKKERRKRTDKIPATQIASLNGFPGTHVHYHHASHSHTDAAATSPQGDSRVTTPAPVETNITRIPFETAITNRVLAIGGPVTLDVKVELQTDAEGPIAELKKEELSVSAHKTRVFAEFFTHNPLSPSKHLFPIAKNIVGELPEDDAEISFFSIF